MKESIDNASINNSAELSATVSSLLGTLDDKNDNVKKAVNDSIRKICRHKPAVVIHAAVYFWELHRKISPEHSTALLTIIAESCKDYANNLDIDLASCVTELAITELTGYTENISFNILVALSNAHCNVTMGGLLTRLEPGNLPHYTIIKAMGMIAGENPFGTIPFIKIILSIMLPMLSQMQEENLKLSSCFTIGKFAEAINDYIINMEDKADPGFCKEAFIEELPSIYDILINDWLSATRDIKFMNGILSTIGAIIPILRKPELSQRMMKLTPTLLQFCKRAGLQLTSSKVLALVLEFSPEEEKDGFRPLLEQIHNTLSDLVCVTPFEVSRDILLTHYEVLQCFRSIVLLYPDEGLDRILQQLKSTLSVQRSRALVVIKHLINTLPTDDDAMLQKIAVNLQDSLNDNNARQIIGAITALAARPNVQLSASQRATYIRFMIIHCGSKTEDAKAFEEALHLLASTVDGAESWLWPCLIRALLDASYLSSVVPVLQALTPLAIKIVRNENTNNEQKEFSGMKVLGRCLELLCEDKNRSAVTSFLRCAAPLFGHQINQLWEVKLLDLSQFLENDFVNNSITDFERNLLWEEKIVHFLEESVQLEGDTWALKLADELRGKTMTPPLSILLSAICRNEADVISLVELSRTQGEKSYGEYSRAVGICAKRHLELILKTMEDLCNIENDKKPAVKLLGLVKDTKAAAMAEAAKAGLLHSYAEIARRGNSAILFPHIQKHIVPWIIRQLKDCKEIPSRKAALIALEQIGYAIHPNRFNESTGLRARSTVLATVLTLLQSPTGYKLKNLYLYIIQTTISLIRLPPALITKEREVLLSTLLDKIIPTCPQQQIVDELRTVCSEIVGDSSDMLAQLVDILIPWVQCTTYMEREIALIILRNTLRTYLHSLKYTFSGGNLEPGKLLGQIISWSADPEHTLRPLVIDCVALSLSIGTRYRTSLPNNILNEDFNEIKKIIVSEDDKVLYDGVKALASATCEKIASGDIVIFAENLIRNLSYHDEKGFAAGIVLSELFTIRGSEIPRACIYLVDHIVSQMRRIENVSCKHNAAVAIKALMLHHPQEVTDELLHQPLLLDHGTEQCWREIGSNEDLGIQILDILLLRLENNFLLSQNASLSSPHSAKSNTASFSSLAAIAALGNLLQSINSETLVHKRLGQLLAVLLKYLSGWLHADAPLSFISTKFGFIPNRDSCKISPCGAVYSVLVNVLTIVDSNDASGLLNNMVFNSAPEAENSLVLVVRSVAKCISKQEHVISEVAKHLGKLITSIIPAQRAVATAFYTEVIGKVDCDLIWLDAIINTFHETRKDSSPFVRKLATIGLTRIAYLEPNQVDEYFDNCVTALLDGLEEPANGGGNDVVLESLRGLSILLSVEMAKPISPHIVLTIRPFIEKDDYEMSLSAINALSALFCSWQQFTDSIDDDIVDQLLGCLPSLTMKLEDSADDISKATRKLLYDSANLMRCKTLAHLMRTYLQPNTKLDLEKYLRELITCLQQELPQRAEELRNAVVMGYSRSENAATRATSALILGLFGQPRPEDIQRLLQLLRDHDSTVKIRAAHALALSFTI